MLYFAGLLFYILKSYFKSKYIFRVLLASSLLLQPIPALEVIWAVNCGGDEHTDVHGIHYQSDPLEIGHKSDFGKSLMIQRVVPQDRILYQTERYHVNTFGYDIPVYRDGDYVIVLKFSEVWFAAPNQKVFDVVLNGEHTVVSELDIFARVGRGAAHDEIIPFSIRAGKLRVNGETSQVDGNKISIEFIKGDLDNPKVNAIYVIKGTVDDVPKLPLMPGVDVPEEEEEEDEESQTIKPQKSRKPSGPKIKDPYAADDTSAMLLPVFVAIGAFIPLLYCLCKL
ncbi:malectin-A [Biomphalaria pfeifferi]|uniref:Malectin-A n=1 Tax=Biomphalaria pfeifferi TaxID=112525 RepID=A0AAD8C9D8_BIOPF|nr:malectin-A [Biomphalaria pfeifferi]